MSTPFLGEILLVSFNFAPTGYIFCEGQLLSIAQNTALFSLLGTTFGGDGITTFALPDLRGRAPISSGQGPGLSNYVLGEALGVENVTLTVAELADHLHPAGASDVSGNSASPGGDVWARSRTRDGIYSSRGPNTTLAPVAIGNAGGGGPHENRPPYLALRYCIAMQGIYPSQN
jgi:microcystin-dependent protein